MTQAEYLDRVEARLARFSKALRMSKSARALQTERAYCAWARRYMLFAGEGGRWKLPPEEIARLFVAAHADRWSVATVNQFRNALVSFYRLAMDRPLGKLGEWAQAKRPVRLPVWLPHEQMLSFLPHLRGLLRLMAEVDYGSGLRSCELARLRWGNIDFTARTITVRGGKGEKDRVTLLPACCVAAVAEHRESCRAMWESDRRLGRAGVEVPSDKFDGTAWEWFWVWPGRNESRDPRSGVLRRHHLHKSTLGKAVAVAVRAWGGDQRITQHSFRHSFATTLLSRGVPIHEVQRLLGHEQIATTQTYAHVAAAFYGAIRSPMDEPATGNVVAFPSAPPDAASARLVAL